MSERISMPEVFMRFAETVALRSVCDRNVQVGCVITSEDLTNVVSIGYNGPARGLPHDCMVVTQIDVTETTRDRPQTIPGSCTCVHAEANAIIKAPYHSGPLTMFTTMSPCPACARLVLNSAVKMVFYRRPYRILDGLNILSAGGVEHGMMTHEDR